MCVGSHLAVYRKFLSLSRLAFRSTDYRVEWDRRVEIPLSNCRDWCCNFVSLP